MKIAQIIAMTLEMVALGLQLPGLTRAEDEFFTGELTAYGLQNFTGGNCAFIGGPPEAHKQLVAMNNEQFLDTKTCGRCVEVSCVDPRCTAKDQKAIAYVVDRCPECKRGDLDLSMTVFAQVTGVSPARLNGKWRFVDCPVTGNIQYCTKGGSNDHWTAIQPTMMRKGIKEIKINDQPTTMVTSAFFYLLETTAAKDLKSIKLTVTPIEGPPIEETIALAEPGQCVEGKHQFPASAGGTETKSLDFKSPAVNGPAPAGRN